MSRDGDNTGAGNVGAGGSDILAIKMSEPPLLLGRNGFLVGKLYLAGYGTLLPP